MSPPPPRLLLALLVAGALPACVQYAPLAGDLPGPGDEVRLRIDPEAGSRLSARSGRAPQVIEGRVTEVSSVDDSLRVLVPWGAAWAGTPMEGRRDEISLHPGEILGVERKEVSRSRTALAAGGLAATAFVLARYALGGSDRENHGGIEEPTPPPVNLTCVLGALTGRAFGACRP